MITTTLRTETPKFGSSPILIHGDYGIGKTLLAAQFEKPYFIMCEKNDDYADKLYYDNATSWQKIVEIINYLVNNQHDFKTIIIDNMNNFCDFASNYLIETTNSDSKKNDKPILTLSDFGYGKGYEMVVNIIKQNLNPLLMQSNLNLICITHSEERQIDTLTGDSFIKIIPLLPNKKVRQYIFSEMPNIFYYHYVKQQRFIQIVGNDFIMAKNRSNGHYLTTSGEPIVNVPAGNSPEEAYKYLQAAYYNKLKNSYKDIK